MPNKHVQDHKNQAWNQSFEYSGEQVILQFIIRPSQRQ